LEAGPARAAKKFGEEAIETVIAATEGDRTALITESADVIYHLIVLLRARDISLEEVMNELERRTGQSGHAEKAGRGN
jgi:phosphoribosyl-ATP pyrophosphohydrolase